jgi:FAD synthase
MDDGRPVSSSRIRQALAEGRIAEAQRLLGR